MSQRLLFLPLIGLALLFSLGCGMVTLAPPDSIDATDAVTGSALLRTSWESGNGFLIDKDERLLLTTARVAAMKGEIDIVFPVVTDGKATVNKSTWLTKAKVGRTVRGKVLRSEPDCDLAVIQLEALPMGVPALKLAAASPEKDAAVHFLGASTDPNLVWAPMTATVSKVAPLKAGQGSNQMIELTGTGAFAKEVAGGAVLNDANEVVGIIPSTPSADGTVRCLDVTEIRQVVSAAFRDKAMSAYNDGKYDVAISYGDKALAAWPEDALAYNERGAAYSQKDQFDKAIADYTKAIELEPGIYLPWRNRGSAYYHTGKSKEALSDLNRAIELNGGYLSAYQTRSKVYTALKMKKEAEADNQAVAALQDLEKKGKEVPLDWRATSVVGGGPSSSPTQDVMNPFPGFRPPTKEDPYWRGPNGKKYIMIYRFGGGGAPGYQKGATDNRGNPLPVLNR